MDFEEGKVGVLMAGIRAEPAVVGKADVGDCRGSLKLNSKGVNAVSSPLRSRFKELLKSPVGLRVRPGGGCIGDLLGDGSVGERFWGDCLRGAPFSPPTGCSFRVAKFRGLRPRTMMEFDVDSATATLVPVARVAISLILRVKCC